MPTVILVHGSSSVSDGQLFGGLVAFQHHLNPPLQRVSYAISRQFPMNHIAAVYTPGRGQGGSVIPPCINPTPLEVAVLPRLLFPVPTHEAAVSADSYLYSRLAVGFPSSPLGNTILFST